MKVPEADFWFCLRPGCPNCIFETFDPRIVTRDHSDHRDYENFTTFNDSHVKFLDMVQRGYLKPPELLEQDVVTLADALNKKFTLYLGSLKDALIKKIQIETNHRYELYGALATKNKQVFLNLKDRIGELAQVDEYVKLYKSLMLQATNSFQNLEQHLELKPTEKVEECERMDASHLKDAQQFKNLQEQFLKAESMIEKQSVELMYQCKLKPNRKLKEKTENLECSKSLEYNLELKLKEKVEECQRMDALHLKDAQQFQNLQEQFLQSESMIQKQSVEFLYQCKLKPNRKLKEINTELTQSIDRLTKVIDEKTEELDRSKSLQENLELKLKEKIEDCERMNASHLKDAQQFKYLQEQFLQAESMIQKQSVEFLYQCKLKPNRKLKEINTELTQSIDRLTKVIQGKTEELDRSKSLQENLELKLKEKIEDCERMNASHLEDLQQKVKEISQHVREIEKLREEVDKLQKQVQKSWRWDEEMKGQNCVIKGSTATGMKNESNCLIAPGFRADETRTIRLRYYYYQQNTIEYGNVQLVDVATRTENHKGFDNRVQAQQGTYAFSWAYYLDKDTDWRDDGYPEEKLICRGQNPEELNLTYDGFTKKMTLHNPNSNASFSLNVNYPPETILQFAVGLYHDTDWFEIIF